MNVQGMRCALAEKRASGGLVEVVGASFIADESSIFGKPDFDYVAREVEWYLSESLNVKGIPGDIPKIWEEVSSEEGFVNSNYGFLFFSPGNCDQFGHVVDELRRDKDSRRACAIYTRPTMHYEYTHHGMRDFVCTNVVQYLIRDDQLEMVVQMRSNDAVYGFKNDIAWQRYTQTKVIDAVKLNYPKLTHGDIHWQVGSLHVYPRHYNLIDEWVKANG